MPKFKYIAIILSLVCILLFIFQTVSPVFTDSLVLDQSSWIQPWRFITSIFLHANLTHLVFNLFALILFGLILEKIIGSNKFLLVFFASGILANLVSVNFYSSSLGASGAVYGVLGCLTILRPKMTVWVYSLPMPLFIAAILWIVISLFGLIVPSDVGHIAHLSGILAGFLLGISYLKEHRQEPRQKLRVVKIPEHYMRNWEDSYMGR